MFCFLVSLAAAVSVVSALPSGSGQAQISVDTRTHFQQVDGLGVSEAFQRAEQIYGKFGLSPTNRSRVVDLLFSNIDGAGLTILRNGIGSSNSSILDHMNSIEPFSPGSPSAPAHYVWNGNDSGQVWLSQDASSFGVRTFYADAWSAPGYMKTNEDDPNGGYLCGVTGTSCTSGDWMQAFANYLVQYVRFYQQSGIKITHLGFLNEPQFSVFYASMLSNGTQAADFIKLLAPTLKAAGLDIKLACCDGEGWNDQAVMLPELQISGAENFLSVITSHGYTSPPGNPLNTTLPVWQTEWADLSGNWTNEWDNTGAAGEGIVWATHIQDAFTKSNVSAFLYWLGAETTPVNSALISLDGDSYMVSKRLWAMAQFSRFVKPGDVRIEATSSEPQLLVSAFQNKIGNVATQVINKATVDYQIELDLSSSGIVRLVEPYLTNNGNDLQPLELLTPEKSGNFKGLVPARSMVSFVGNIL
jgi:O-glycosyl hydrolase